MTVNLPMTRSNLVFSSSFLLPKLQNILRTARDQFLASTELRKDLKWASSFLILSCTTFIIGKMVLRTPKNETKREALIRSIVSFSIVMVSGIELGISLRALYMYSRIDQV